MARKRSNNQYTLDAKAHEAAKQQQLQEIEVEKQKEMMENFVKEKLVPSNDPADYKILVNRNHVSLEADVVRYINDGWTLVGGVSIATHTSQYEVSLIFSQAITKNI